MTREANSIVETRDDVRPDVHYCTLEDSRTVKNEVLECAEERYSHVKSTFTKMLKEADFEGAVKAHLQSFAEGRLPRASDSNPRAGSFEPVVTQPDLWEIKYPKSLGLYRSYHAEVRDPSIMVVVLRFHEKQVDNLTSAQVEKSQNDEMALAQERYKTYEQCQWGHCHNCRFCI